MGKAIKPLTIVALPPCDTWEELWQLEQKGHIILRLSLIEKGFRIQGAETHVDMLQLILDADIIIGGNCWRMSPAHRKYLVLAIREARMLRYGSSENRANKKNRDQVAADIVFDLPIEDPEPGDTTSTE